jgi:predicted dinucleotide-binding enzyme
MPALRLLRANDKFGSQSVGLPRSDSKPKIMEFIISKSKKENAMKVGILGSGDVGKALGNGFIKHGYEVMIGTRNAAKLADWREKSGNKARVGSFAETAAFGELIVLAVKGSIALETLKMAGAANLKGKTVIDATNPIAEQPPVNGVLKFYTTLDQSLMEQLQSAYPEAYFVKAFNSVGNAMMVNPDFGGLKPSMFICGNNQDAKKQAGKIIEQFGFEVEDMGSAEAARAIEPLCMLWCIPGFLKNQWTHAFKLLKQ